MRIRTLGVLAVLSAGLAAPVAAQEPFARIELRDPEPVLVSAGARVAIDVLVPSFFRGPVEFPDEIEMPGAIVLLQPGSSTNLNERIDGSSWAGIRRTYRVYPIRPGTVTLDPVPVRIVYALDDGSASAPIVVRTPALELETAVPAAAADLRQFFASEAFEMNSTNEPADAIVRVGESLRREVTMRATNTPGLFLPDLRFEAVEGVSIYPGQPGLTERGGQRGAARVAERTETVTYAFASEGEFELPGFAVNWWDLETDTLREATVPALTVVVQANPDLDAAMLESDAAAVEEEVPGRGWVAMLRTYWRHLLLAGVGILAARRWLLPSLRRVGAGLRAREAARAESEERYFRDFTRIARTGSAVEVHGALLRWLDRWAAPGRTTTLESFAREDDETLRAQTEGLAADAFGRGGTWSAPELVRAVDRARRRRSDTTPGGPALPPLNPA